METKSKRPFGVSFLGWFNALTGGVMMLAALGKVGPAAGGLFIAGGISVVVGVGLLRLRGWARTVAIVCYAVGILVGIAHLNPIGIIASALFLVYLCSPQVAAAFAARPSPEPVEAARTSGTDQKAA